MGYVGKEILHARIIRFDTFIPYLHLFRFIHPVIDRSRTGEINKQDYRHMKQES